MSSRNTKEPSPDETNVELSPANQIARQYARAFLRFLREKNPTTQAPPEHLQLRLEELLTLTIHEAINTAITDLNAETLALMQLFHDFLSDALGHEEMHDRMDELRATFRARAMKARLQ